MGDLVVIADVHMGAGPHDDFPDEAALVTFLDDLVDPSWREGRPATLLVLGDLLDLITPPAASAGPEARALERLERVAGAHRAVFAALGRLAAAGVVIEYVLGNHDAELVRPRLQRRFRTLLREGAGGLEDDALDVRFHRWLLHRPGELYAEHGHQHHEINGMPALLAGGPPGSRDPLADPPGTVLVRFLDARRTAGDGAPGLARQVRATARLGVGLAGAASRMAAVARRPPGAEELATATPGSGPPPAALAELARLTCVGPVAAVRRIAARRRAGRDYMLDAAGRVHGVLARHDAAVPLYLFAHTHVPVDASVAGGRRYVNPGTWSRIRPAGGTAPTFAEVRVGGAGPPRARVLRWDAAAQRARASEAAVEAAA